ncbi:MAG: hypothetical protein IPN71_04060 [Fibrobacteres bacterium]|jgi:hypothetical protein|nr:hypothetical protein [Fibrobacterota bacterium]
MSQALPQNFRQLLAALPLPFRQAVVESLLSDKEAKSAAQEAMQALASLRKMRPQTIAQLSRADRTRLFLSSLGLAAIETSAMQCFQVWFLRHGRELMGSMLDAWKVTHTLGELADDAQIPAVDEAAVEAAAQEAIKTYPREAVAAYLGYNHLAPAAASWEGMFASALSKHLEGI